MQQSRETFYAESMVIQGYLATAQSQLTGFLDDPRKFTKKNVRCCLANVAEALILTQDLSDNLGKD